jgi:hypothetical protein
VDEGHPAPACQAGRRGDPQAELDESGRRELAAPEHRERLDTGLDAGGPQLADQGAVLGEDDEGPVAGGIEAGGDQRELAVCSIATG